MTRPEQNAAADGVAHAWDRWLDAHTDELIAAVAGDVIGKSGGGAE